MPKGGGNSVENDWLRYRRAFSKLYIVMHIIAGCYPKQRQRLIAAMWHYESSEVRERFRSMYLTALAKVGVTMLDESLSERKDRLAPMNVRREDKRKNRSDGSALNWRCQQMFDLWSAKVEGAAFLAALVDLTLCRQNNLFRRCLCHPSFQNLRILWLQSKERHALARHGFFPPKSKDAENLVAPEPVVQVPGYDLPFTCASTTSSTCAPDNLVANPLFSAIFSATPSNTFIPGDSAMQHSLYNPIYSSPTDTPRAPAYVAEALGSCISGQSGAQPSGSDLPVSWPTYWPTPSVSAASDSTVSGAIAPYVNGHIESSLNPLLQQNNQMFPAPQLDLNYIPGSAMNSTTTSALFDSSFASPCFDVYSGSSV